MAGPLISLDADQQTSATHKDFPQNDRWHAEEIRPRHGTAFTLVVIADGDGSEAAGALAELVVQIGFAEARLMRDEPLLRLFKHIFNQMNEVVCRQGAGDVVGLTAAAIRGGALTIVQAGSQTRCYKVRGERAAIPLTKDNDNALGKTSSLHGLSIAQYKLKRGDKLVFCSDGLYGGGLVSATEIARIDPYDDIKGAARHLSALAMGRNVADNVTVVVLSYGRMIALSLRNVVFDILGILLAMLIVGGIALMVYRVSRVTPRPPDIGIAVLAEGTAEQVEALQVITPGSDLSTTAESPALIKLKKRELPDSEVTITIPAVDLFFGTSTNANLTSMNIEGFIDPETGINQPTTLTEIKLYQGRALILNRENRTFYVWLGLPTGLGSPLVILQGAGTALGVNVQEGQVTAYCLQGDCSIKIGKEREPFGSSSKVSFSIEEFSLSKLLTQPIEDTDRSSWLALCSTWQPNPDNLQGTCGLISH